MQNFFIFYAPFIVLIGAVIAAFWLAPKDGSIKN
ncbi:cytochrome bd oxidase small subunit CydS [Siminovitchia sp. 179-K 8D1 HS]